MGVNGNLKINNMKLYLSSYRIPDLKKFSSFVGGKPSDIKVGLILNAKDCKSTKDRSDKLKEMLGYFSEFGFQIDEIDLREYFNNDGLGEKLKDYDVIWVDGGNTYMLRWAIVQCCGEKAILDALESGVVYGGDSAGAIIVGPTLKYFDEADDPTVVPKTMYDGLGLIDFAVLPHWASEGFGEANKVVKRKLEEDGYKTIKLTDKEFLLVEGGDIIN